jgi:hypothetical protein
VGREAVEGHLTDGVVFGNGGDGGGVQKWRKQEGEDVGMV